jgi:hypothetical protein
MNYPAVEGRIVAAVHPNKGDMVMSRLCVVIALVILAGIWGCQKPVDIEAEKEAIKAVILKQLDAVKEMSAEGEASVWAHTPYVVREELVGWDSISIFYNDTFKKWKSEPDNYSFKEFSASNFDIYVNGNFASVFHDQKWEGIIEGKEQSSSSRMLRYLERINGEWKVLTFFSVK